MQTLEQLETELTVALAQQESLHAKLSPLEDEYSKLDARISGLRNAAFNLKVGMKKRTEANCVGMVMCQSSPDTKDYVEITTGYNCAVFCCVNYIGKNTRQTSVVMKKENVKQFYDILTANMHRLVGGVNE